MNMEKVKVAEEKEKVSKEWTTWYTIPYRKAKQLRQFRKVSEKTNRQKEQYGKSRNTPIYMKLLIW